MIWKKSSYSGDTANCVEVARGPQVWVRDSKNPTGPVLSFAPESWREFFATVRNGDPQ